MDPRCNQCAIRCNQQEPPAHRPSGPIRSFAHGSRVGELASQRAIDVARGSKSGAHDNSSTATRHFERYASQICYDWRNGLHADDALEISALGREPLGRLWDFTCWLVADRPGIKGSTISQYVSTVRQFLYDYTGYLCSLSGLLSKYMLRLRQAPSERRHRFPAPVGLVRRVVDDASIPLGVRVAVLCAYTALLRGGEICSTRADLATATFSLRADHVCWSADMGGYAIYIARSKGDRYNVGKYTYITINPGDPYCPAAAISWYLQTEPLARRTGLHPFFVRRDANGKAFAVTKHDIACALKAHSAEFGLPLDRVSGHSLRIGGCFQLISSGASWQDVAVRGGWSLEATNRMVPMYAQWSVQRVTALSGALSLNMPVSERARFVVPNFSK